MWDRPDHPEVAFDADGALFTLFQPDELYQKEMSPLGFFRCISLTDNDFYASGITIHFLSECITGIESHFPTTSNLVGSHGDTTLHFPLAQSERIANVWLRLKTHGLYYSMPSLLVSVWISVFEKQKLMLSRFILHWVGTIVSAHTSVEADTLSIGGYP